VYLSRVRRCSAGSTSACCNSVRAWRISVACDVAQLAVRRLAVSSVRAWRISVECDVAQLVYSTSAWCKASWQSSILGSAPQVGFSHWAYWRWEDKNLRDLRRINVLHKCNACSKNNKINIFAVWKYVNKGKLLSSFFKKQGIDILFVLVSIFGTPCIIYNGESILRNRQEVRFRVRSLEGRINGKYGMLISLELFV
jgi:hypothetical protein